MPTEEEKKLPYYRTIAVKNHDMDKAIEELDRQSNVYEKEHKVLHRDYTLVYGYQIWVATRSFCCETEEGETY